MNREKLKRTLIDVGRDVLIAFTVVCIVMAGLYAYCGIWPPMVVVESGSMQRSDATSYVGVIDTGDMVFVKTVNGVDDVVTYVDGEATGYSKYGTYGDVIIYRPNGLSVREDGSAVVPIIHRLVVWIEVNLSAVNPEFNGTDYENITFDVPSLNVYATTDVLVLQNYGYWEDEVRINLGGLLTYYENTGKEPHGGYITMGDNNVPFYDQPQSGMYEPILPEWIIGKAIGEIPWFGLIKLKVTGSPLHGVPPNSWTGLYITLFLVLFVPFMIDMLMPRIVKWRKVRRGAEAAPETEQPPEAPEPPKDTENQPKDDALPPTPEKLD
jgi:signal peptidase